MSEVNAGELEAFRLMHQKNRDLAELLGATGETTVEGVAPIVVRQADPRPGPEPPEPEDDLGPGWGSESFVVPASLIFGEMAGGEEGA